MVNKQHHHCRSHHDLHYKAFWFTKKIMASENVCFLVAVAVAFLEITKHERAPFPTNAFYGLPL